MNDDAASSASVNQKIAPAGFVEAGSTFQDLGTFSFSGNTITVTLTNLANGVMIADAIRIERI